VSESLESPGATGQAQAQTERSAIVGSPTGVTPSSHSPSGDTRVAGTEQPPTGEEGGTALTWEQRAKEWQSNHDRLRGQLTPILKRIEKGEITAEGIDGILNRTEMMLGHPVLGKLMRDYVQTGRVEIAPTSTDDDDDPFEDESTKVLRGQVNELKAQIQQLSQGSLQQAHSLAMQKITESADTFMKEYEGLTPEEMQSFRTAVTERVAVMARTNPQMVLNMDGDTFEMIALPALKRVVPLTTLGERQLQRRKAQLSSATTDGALGVATTGQEPAARQSGQGMSIEDSARAAMNRFFSAHGR
jgi:hypothetical protein